MNRAGSYQMFGGKKLMRINSLEQHLGYTCSRYMTDIRILNGLSKCVI